MESSLQDFDEINMSALSGDIKADYTEEIKSDNKNVN